MLTLFFHFFFVWHHNLYSKTQIQYWSDHLWGGASLLGDQFSLPYAESHRYLLGAITAWIKADFKWSISCHEERSTFSKQVENKNLQISRKQINFSLATDGQALCNLTLSHLAFTTWYYLVTLAWHYNSCASVEAGQHCTEKTACYICLTEWQTPAKLKLPVHILSLRCLILPLPVYIPP